jgi:hypothetical protein
MNGETEKTVVANGDEPKAAPAVTANGDVPEKEAAETTPEPETEAAAEKADEGEKVEEGEKAPGSCCFFHTSGDWPTIASYNATGSLERFDNKNIFFYFEKRSSLLQRWRCRCTITSYSISVVKFTAQRIA